MICIIGDDAFYKAALKLFFCKIYQANQRVKIGRLLLNSLSKLTNFIYLYNPGCDNHGTFLLIEERGPRIYKFPHLPFFLIGNLLIVHYSKNFTINITIELLNSEF
ncbi:uncharacterized protein OCT59_019203 [Rhizophagus irregularis]|uniref:uncharacterized protein n=1 Tax=Rhizophagus irregularis TaxID=588596 RepID=UPI0033330B28|nr:hypothetical protein OCT59_019203 [Rhizophagus irregularis]